MIVDIEKIEEIEMDLVGLCNLKCPLCTRNYSHASHMLGKNVRPIEEVIEQLDRFTGLKRFFIAGAVSEPTMYKYFIEFIEYLNSRGIYYEIFTNGNTHNESWWNKLAEIVPSRCMTVFTICGSTQEIHEKYRVGSSLEDILSHAEAYRRAGGNNDYVQHILFKYNQNDLNNNMEPILSQFSGRIMVNTEGVRRLNEHIIEVDDNISPISVRDKTIRQLFKTRPKPDDGKDYEIQCKSIQENKVYIDQYGKISACYIHAEFEKDYFKGSKFDYGDILDFKYKDCFLCEKRTRTFIERIGLDFVC